MDFLQNGSLRFDSFGKQICPSHFYIIIGNKAVSVIHEVYEVCINCCKIVFTLNLNENPEWI